MEFERVYVYLILIFFVVLLVSLKNYIRTVILAFQLDGPPAVPILGNVFLVTDSGRLQEVGTNAHQYGSLMRCWVFLIPFVMVYEPHHLKIILGSSRKSKKNIFYTVLHNFVGEGLITNDGYKWKKNRRLIQPYFHVNFLDRFVKIFTRYSDEFVNSLEGKTDVKITDPVNKCILNILHKAVLGVSLENDFSPFRKGELLILKRLLKPWLLLDPIFKFTSLGENEVQQKTDLHNFTRKVLSDRIKQPKRLAEDMSLLDMFIEISENNPEFTENDIINEACTFMLAGQDSVGAAAAFSLFFLAKHQEHQQKVFEELEGILPVDSARLPDITLTELNRMVYLEQCVKESLRLVPSIPLISRILTEDVALDDHVLPSGTNVFFSPFITHRLPHVFPDPMKFDPERFSPENVSKIHPYGYLPFSLGPRNCIGYKFAILELKCLIASVLRKYHVTLPPGHENYTISYRVSIRAKGGIYLKLNPRHVQYSS